MTNQATPSNDELILTARQMLKQKLAEGINEQTNREMMVIGIALNTLLKPKGEVGDDY